MKRLAWIWPVLAVAWIVFLAKGAGPLPPLGPLLDFHSGVWRHSDFQWHDQNIPGLKQPVQVAIDKAGVPHIFAENEDDLYVAQGYIMASQRLFQMDLSSRSTAGRLSELVGPRLLPMDRFFVRFGMRQLAMKRLNEFMSDPRTALMLESFTAGVNAYIRQMTELPVEYKLIGKRPELFDPSRVVHMALALTFSLNGRASGYVMSHLQQEIGTEKVLDLFPEFLPDEYSDYVLPGHWAPKPRRPETKDLFAFQTHIKNFPEIPQPAPGNGSNNWVIGPKKSMTGHSILANDTHLGLSLPNVWYENQLSCPDFNVYGVSLVDVPGIVNGFNSKTAWGPTNGTTAALDYYEVEFTGDDSLEYKEGDKTETAIAVRETIDVKGATGEDVDVIVTKWGPVIYREGKYGLVANWTGFRTGNDLLALRRLYDSTDVKTCLSSFDDWSTPIQNFVCADPDHIGITHAGFIPKRAPGEGRFIDAAGASPTSLNVPIEEKFRPKRIDPPEGYLHSANQRVVDDTYPYYLGWDYEEPFRGARIRRLIEAQDKLSVEDVIRIQNDAYDPQAAVVLPVMLKELKADSLAVPERDFATKLKGWNLRDLAGEAEPAFFKIWFQQLKAEIFSDEYSLPERPHFFPHDMRIAWMLKRVSENPRDSDAQWIDDKKTHQVETLSDIVTRAYQKAWDTMVSEQGKDPSSWTWKNFIKTRIPHIAKIPGFGSPLLEMDGSGESVRGNQGWHGAVYKFVIELGEHPNAWISVPGGNNGDPFSPDFERGVVDWSQGVMRKAEFYSNLQEARKHAVKVVEFQPQAGGR